MLAELELIQSKLLAECSNSPCPCWQGSGYELSGTGHAAQKDNKLARILRYAHYSQPPANWSSAVHERDAAPDSVTVQAFSVPGNHARNSLALWLNMSTPGREQRCWAR